MNKQKQEKERFYRQLFAVLSEPPKGNTGANQIFRKVYEICEAYNAKYSEGISESAIAAALTHLEKHGIVKRIRHYAGAWWYLALGANLPKSEIKRSANLVEGASIDWLFE